MSRERPVLWGAALAGVLLVVLVAWFGRACWGGWWIVDRTPGADTYLVSTIWERSAAQVAGGHLPLWFPEFAGGHPLHAAWMYGLFYPPTLVFGVLAPEAAWTWLAIAHVVLGALGMYAFLWDERRDEAAAAAGAVVFALSGFVLARVLSGHLNIVMPLAWAPWVLRAALRTVRGQRGAAAWLGLCGGIGLIAGHVQVWFYVAPLVAAACAFEALRRGVLRTAAVRLLLGAGIALGVAAIQWIPAWELFAVSGHPPENREIVASCSATPAALVAQAAPRLIPVEGEFAHEAVGLAGPLAVAAALLALRLRDARRWFWFAVLAAGVVLALGLTNDVSRFANGLPPLRWARAPGRAMALVVLAGSVLAADLVADRVAGRSWWLRALAPAAFLVSALALGVPAPDVVRSDFHDHDWMRGMPPAEAQHRVHVSRGRYPYVERFGVRTVREVCPLDTPGHEAVSAMPQDVAAWWFDVEGRLTVPWDGPPVDGEATAALARDGTLRSFGAAGPVRTYFGANFADDEEVVRALREGGRSLWLPPSEEHSGAWCSDGTEPSHRADFGSAPDRIVVTNEPPSTGIAFVSAKWYPGWEVSPPSRLARANLAFLALSLEVRSGSAIEIRYRPWWRLPALLVSCGTLLVSVLVVARRR